MSVANQWFLIHEGVLGSCFVKQYLVDVRSGLMIFEYSKPCSDNVFGWLFNRRRRACAILHTMLNGRSYPGRYIVYAGICVGGVCRRCVRVCVGVCAYLCLGHILVVCVVNLLKISSVSLSFYVVLC
jgi:hypothetical protein